MATLTQNPCPTKFVGDMQDMILSSADSVEFQLKQGGTLVLKETYNPANGSIRIGGLDKVVDTCLYGDLKEEGGQDHLSASFGFFVDGTSLLTQTLYASHQRNTFDTIGAKMILTHGTVDVCRPGVPHPLTFLATATARLYNKSGEQINSRPLGSVTAYTEDCDPEQLFPSNYDEGAYIEYSCGNDTLKSYIDFREYPDATSFLFLNMYDAPEVLSTKKALSVKPQSTDDIGTSYGEDRKYHIEQTDEYNADSGALMTRGEYAQWRDLVMSRKVQVLWDGRWLPIIVTKTNYSHTMRKGSFGGIGFSFRMARQRDNGMITL